MGPNLAEFIIDIAYSAVVSMDDQGLVIAWNPSAEKTFGRPREEAIGRPVADLIIPERLRSAHREGLSRFLATGEGPILDRQLELTAQRADGTEFPVELTISKLRDGGRWSFHAFIRDITEFKAAEQERERLTEELNRALRGSERRFDAIVGSLSDPITIRDREHRFIYANAAGVAHLGFQSWEELRDTDPSAIMDDYLVHGEDGRDVRMQDIPSVRILNGEPAEPLLIRTVHRTTGVQAWNLLKAAPLLDEDGQVEATITIIEDVTERKRAQQRSAFLGSASTVLASSLDYEETLRNVAALAVPEVADWCAVDLFDEDGDRQAVIVAHVDPERLSLAEELRSYEPDRLQPDQGLGRVLRTGETLLYPEVPDALLVAAAVDDRHLELLRKVGLRSVLMVPMKLGGRILGALTLVSSDSGRVLDQFDQQLAEQVAARAAVAIENSRLYSERSLIARTLQESLMPERLPVVPGYELASAYVPAMESSLVGGDFYDVWPVGDSWMVIIGDVTGKGVQAAALTSLVRHTMQTASQFRSSPAELLARVDSTLKIRPTLSVCTALCLRLDPDRATLAVAGHPLPVRIDGLQVSTVGRPGPLLGAFAEAGWEDVVVELRPGSTLLAYTDGITDAVGKDGRRFGFERLCATLAGGEDRSAAEVIQHLFGVLGEFQTEVHADDTAAIAIRRMADDGAQAIAPSAEVRDTSHHDDGLAENKDDQTS